MSEKSTYLCIGHCCHDKIDDQYILGGTVSYSSMLAKSLGFESALLTSFGDDFLFEDIFIEQEITLHRVPAPQTTVFENQYVGDKRTQTILARAEQIRVEDYEKLNTTSSIIHFSPIANEVDLELAALLDAEVISLATPQGWLRKWDRNGVVSFQNMDWEKLSGVDFVIISEEDIPDLDQKLNSIRENISKLIVTQGSKGATIYLEDSELHFPAYATTTIDSTGAGDTFATGFITKYAESKDIAESMIYANCLSSICIEHEGTLFFDKIHEVDSRVREYLKLFHINK